MTTSSDKKMHKQRSSLFANIKAIESISGQQQDSYFQQSHLALQRWSVLLAAPIAIVVFGINAIRPSATWREVTILFSLLAATASWMHALGQTKKGNTDKAATIFICSVIGFVSICMCLFRGMAGTSLLAMATMVVYAALVSTRLLYFTTIASLLGFLLPEMLHALNAYPIPQRDSFERLTNSVAFSAILIPVMIRILLSRRQMNQHLTDTLTQMNSTQETTITTALEVTSDIETTLKNISQIAETFRSQAGDQAAAITHINAAVAELGGRTGQTTDAAKSATEVVIKIKERSSQGISRLSVIEKGVQLIVGVNKVVQEEFDELAAQAENIEDILKLNREIAGQIKILAVNAGIQAAKAGSYGSGFRVVANELKAMITRTDESLSAGREILEQIRTHARHSAYSIQKSSALLNAQFEELSSTAASIEEIAESFNETSKRIATITQEVRRQQESLEDVRNSADYIDFSSQDLEHSSKALRASLARIEESTKSLRQALV